MTEFCNVCMLFSYYALMMNGNAKELSLKYNYRGNHIITVSPIYGVNPLD